MDDPVLAFLVAFVTLLCLFGIPVGIIHLIVTQ